MLVLQLNHASERGSNTPGLTGLVAQVPYTLVCDQCERWNARVYMCPHMGIIGYLMSKFEFEDTMWTKCNGI